MEKRYLDLAEEILTTGDPRVDRTGVGTKSLFGTVLRFDLSDGSVPVLTTKRVAWKHAVKEMLWFLTGDTNIRNLLREGVTIWSDWPHKAYVEKTGDDISQKAFESRILEDEAFAREWGDLGPVYGKQWRCWEGPDGKIHDQIGHLITMLRETPASRRMLFHGWNVADLDKMALPPCHMLYQYHVSSEGKLNSILYQRSCDVFLGLPFNLTGAATLQIMLAQQAGLAPGRLTWMGGDTHVYTNHFDQIREQISREPRELPKMRVRKAASIDDYRIEDFELLGYDPHPSIKGEVAV